MANTKENIKFSYASIKSFLKWILIATITGILGGTIGAVFHKCIDYVAHIRGQNNSIIFFLPVAGIIITAMYNAFRKNGKIDTNRVIISIRENEKIPFVMVPLIFIGTVITHLFGGSAGREGAALQIGGGIGYKLGKILRLNKNDLNIITMAGMSSVFSALFATPVTAAVFSLEVIRVGMLNYTGLLGCIIASSVAYYVSFLLGVEPVKFTDIKTLAINPQNILRIILLAVLCAIVSVLFCTAIKKTEHIMKRFFKNDYLRAAFGGALIVVLTIMLGTTAYNGAGMEIVEKAISGQANLEDFILKIIFTAITISAGFKGGEIVPSFFIGSTFGALTAPFIGLDAGFGGAIGLVCLFCGVVN